MLVLRNRNGTVSFLHSSEGVTQGDPLSIIAYGIGTPPIKKNLKYEITDVTQPWYADNAGALGMIVRIETYFNFMTR